MNRPIVRLYGFVALLFALLVAFTSRWTIFEASSLRANPLNVRGLLEQERIERGPILAADGTVLARSRRGPEGTFQRSYPAGGLFAQTIGYSYTDLGQAGLERYRNGRAERRIEHQQPADDPRPAAGQAQAGRRSDHDAQPGGAAYGDQRARLNTGARSSRWNRAAGPSR